MATRRTSRVSVQRAAGIAALVVAAGGTAVLATMPLRQPPAYTPATPLTSTSTIPAAPSASVSTSSPVSTTTSVGPVSGGLTTTSLAPTAGGSATTTSGGLPPTALVVGDGFTATGRAANGVEDQSFACQAVRSRGWGCINESSTGSGYLSAGSAGTFAQQLAQAVTPTQVGLVVITGGVADRLASPSAAETAVTATVADAQKAYPSATVVVLRPFATQRNTTTLRAVALTLGRLAQAPKVDYVDTLTWFDQVSPATTTDGGALTSGASAVAASQLYAVLPTAP